MSNEFIFIYDENSYDKQYDKKENRATGKNATSFTNFIQQSYVFSNLDGNDVKQKLRRFFDFLENNLNFEYELLNLSIKGLELKTIISNSKKMILILNQKKTKLNIA